MWNVDVLQLEAIREAELHQSSTVMQFSPLNHTGVILFMYIAYKLRLQKILMS